MASTCHNTTTARPSFSALSFIVSVIVAGLQKLGRALKHRRDASLLAGLDDRMLGDIGLTRSDLRDAYAEPLWRDPTDVLAGRAGDKRKYRQAGVGPHGLHAPSLVPDAPVTDHRVCRIARRAA